MTWPMSQQRITFVRPSVIFLSLLLIGIGCQSEDTQPAAPADATGEAAGAAETEPASPQPTSARAPEQEAETPAGPADASADPDPEADEDLTEVGSMEELVACMAEAGVVIYGSVTCPFCTQLADAFGGADVVKPIYVECTEDRERCMNEMIGRGVPEIQIRGEMYRGPSRQPADIGREAGCNLVQ